jgi:hypothetical protein
LYETPIIYRDFQSSPQIMMQLPPNKPSLAAATCRWITVVPEKPLNEGNYYYKRANVVAVIVVRSCTIPSPIRIDRRTNLCQNFVLHIRLLNEVF